MPKCLHANDIYSITKNKKNKRKAHRFKNLCCSEGRRGRASELHDLRSKMSDSVLVNESSPKGCATTDLVERDDLTSKIAAKLQQTHSTNT